MEEELREALRDCVEAMTRSIEEGCTDHLDATDDAGEFWHGAVERATKLLGRKEDRKQDFRDFLKGE